MVGYELVVKAEDLGELIDALPLIKTKLAQGFNQGIEGNDVYYDLTKLDELWVTPEALQRNPKEVFSEGEELGNGSDRQD